MLSKFLRALPLALATCFQAQADVATLKDGGHSRVVEVVDGDTVILKDGRQVRLVGTQAPKLPLGRKDFKKWPLADEAKKILEELALDREVVLKYGGRRVDRHGRALAHLFAYSDGEERIWLQAAMLSRGMARVYTFYDNRAVVDELLEKEREARADRLGIWRHPYYQIRDADELDRYVGSFQVIEGRVKKIADVRGRVFFNFGRDWKTDFTITVPAKARRSFEKADFPFRRLEGRRIRVRGWLKKRNGPMIEASHPEQIELLQ